MQPSSGEKTQAAPAAASLRWASEEASNRLAESLRQWLSGVPVSEAENPGNRIPFHWPLPSIANEYRLTEADWTGSMEGKICGELNLIETAHTDAGWFGRCSALWVDAHTPLKERELPRALSRRSSPFMERMRSISDALGLKQRFRGHVRDLSPENLLKLLFCKDRDVANEARIEIEKAAANRLYTPALIEILEDKRHPMRRSAQWCVLDMFEDLPEYCRSKAEEDRAAAAMRKIIWEATDDYARAVYKAGVVLGGHLPETYGGPILIECLDSPSPIGRRSAIHGLFHVVEWVPELRGSVVSRLTAHAASEKEPLLREFALGIASNLENEEFDHVIEPLLPGEATVPPPAPHGRRRRTKMDATP